MQGRRAFRTSLELNARTNHLEIEEMGLKFSTSNNSQVKLMLGSHNCSAHHQEHGEEHGEAGSTGRPGAWGGQEHGKARSRRSRFRLTLS